MEQKYFLFSSFFLQFFNNDSQNRLFEIYFQTFIRRCLTYNVRDRPDVNQLADDEYLRSYPKRTTTSSSARITQLTMNDGSN